MMSSLALSYGLVLMSPGPNLLMVLRVAIKPSWNRLLSVGAGLATGAALACFLAGVTTAAFATVQHLEAWGSILLSTILLYSSVRLLRHTPNSAARQASRDEALNLRLYGLGVATALSNPLSVPFFISFYLAEPSLRSPSGSAAVCAMIFAMALIWFVTVGRIFSVAAISQAGARWQKRARYLLSALMTIYAVKLIYGAVIVFMAAH